MREAARRHLERRTRAEDLHPPPERAAHLVMEQAHRRCAQRVERQLTLLIVGRPRTQRRTHLHHGQAVEHADHPFARLVTRLHHLEPRAPRERLEPIRRVEALRHQSKRLPRRGQLVPFRHDAAKEDRAHLVQRVLQQLVLHRGGFGVGGPAEEPFGELEVT